MRVVTLLIIMAMLSGCKEAAVEKVVLRPTPQVVTAKPVYTPPSAPSPKVEITIKEVTVSKQPIQTASISTPVSKSAHEQARHIFGQPKPVADATMQKAVHNTRVYLISQPVRWLDINYTTQKMELWENGKMLNTFPISGSRGKTFSETYEPPGEKTPHNHIGVFQILDKAPKKWSNLFDVYMVRWQQYHRGHAIHNCQPDHRKYLGQGASGGCVRAAPEDNPYDWDKIGDIVFCHL